MFTPLVLAIWGTVMLDVVTTGQVRTLLHPVFYPWVEVTGAALLIIAISLIFTPGALHPESWSTWSTRGVLLIAPLLLALYAAPATYSAYTVMNRQQSPASTAPSSPARDSTTETHFPTKPGVAPMVIDLDYLLSADDEDRRGLLGGKIVKIAGQVYPVNDHDFKLVRLFIYCCAADASTLMVDVQGNSGAIQPTDWVNLTGEVQFRQTNSQWQPFLKLERIEKTSAPADPYLYSSQ